MKHPLLRTILFFIAVILVAASSCYISGHLFSRRSGDKVANAHQWLHDELGLTKEQEQRLEPIEHRFAERKKSLMEAIRLANMELAQAITEDRKYSSKVEAAVEKIHQAQGDLQRATLEHMFEMQSVLTPAQSDKLLKIVGDALFLESK